MASFNERLREAMGPRGYDATMRRSIQSIVLYEARRCLGNRLSELALRPFQRKIAFWDMTNHILQSTDLLPHQKDEIMWRTGTSKEPMQPDTTWKRSKMIEKELENIVEKIRPFLEGRTHEEACEYFVQHQYESVTGNKGKPRPAHWEFSHNNCLLCYRTYYRGSEPDPSLPPAKPPKPVLIAQERPPRIGSTIVITQTTSSLVEPDNHNNHNDHAKEEDINDEDIESIVRQDTPVNPEDRRLLLQEVREHLELLKEFEGIIPQEELNQRKRELFLALPSAPPPVPARKEKRMSEGGSVCQLSKRGRSDGFSMNIEPSG